MKNIIFFLIGGFFLQFLSAQESGIDDPQAVLEKHKEHLLQNFLKSAGNKEAEASQTGYDALYYRLNLGMKYTPNLLTGNVLGRFSSNREQLSKIILDMDTRLTISGVTGNVSSYNHSGQFLEVNLDRPYNLGEIFQIEVDYSGVPAQGTGYNYFRFDQLSDGSPHVWTLSEPYGARYWWPCKDTPRDKPDSVDIIVTVPSGQLVASNGSLREVIENGDGTSTFHWHERYPIATYLVSLAIGYYANFQDQYISANNDTLLLDYYVDPVNLSEAQSIFSEMHDYLDALSFYFGPYPFMQEKYGMAEFGWGGGMEHQTITSIGNVSESWRYIYVHELGHQWFGDLVTCDSWQEIWLNEGFASYSEALYAEWAGYRGNPPGKESYHAYINTQQFLSDGTIIRQDTTSFGSLFNRIVYEKGSWVLHMLRRIVGEEDFFKILREYLNDPRWTFASVKTENFIEVCENVSGLELEVFFDQWLNFPYYPEYAYRWEVTERGANIFDVEVIILQEQRTVIYEMPVDIKFAFPSGRDTLITFYNDRAEQRYLVQFAEEPLKMVFDPDNWILKEAAPYSDAKFTSEVVIEEYYPNPFNEEVTIKVRNWFFETITLEIYDIAGKKLTVLHPVNNTMDRSYEFRWDGRSQSGYRVSSGIYVVVPVGDNATKSHAKKLIKLR